MYNDQVMDFVYSGNTPVVMICNDSVYFYASNLQGDIVAILDSNGNPVVEYTYDAWGKILTITGSMASTLGVLNPLRYRGYVYDNESGLYYLQSRYYDPAIGRFINADAFVSTGQGILGHNMFAYCNNEPINRVDYTGKRYALYKGDLAGYGGGVDFAIPSCYPFLQLADYLSTAFTAKQTVAREYEKANVYIDAKTGQTKQYQYWEAARIGNSVVVGDGLTFVEASARVAGGSNVMCANQDAAKWILVVNCYWNAVGPEIGRGEGFYYHYHPHRNTKVHIWFYGGVDS